MAPAYRARSKPAWPAVEACRAARQHRSDQTGDGNAQDEDQGKRKEALQGHCDRENQISRTTKFIRNARGTTVLSEPDTKIVKTYMPYAR